MKQTLLKNMVISLLFFIAMNTALNAQPFRLFAVSDLKRVFEDGYNLPPASDSIKIFGIRGEIISGQCAVNTKSNLTNLTVELSPLKHQVTGSSLPSSAIDWNFVGSIPLSVNAPNQPLDIVVRKAPARFPEYLMEEKMMNINKGTYQSIWITITIPETAEAGTYLGKVTLKSSQGEQSLPLQVTVYPLTMPSGRNLKVAEWYTTRHFERWHGIKEVYSDEWFKMLRIYADNMVSHRQNIFQVPMNSIEIRKTKNGGLEFDFKRFDQIAQVFWSTGKMDYLETGELAKFKDNWFGTEIVLKDFSVTNLETGEKITMAGDEVVPYLLPAFERHLRQMGWLHKTLFHVKDEPTLRNSLSWREMSRYMHKFAPDLTRIDAVETTYLFGDIEISIPKIDYLAANYELYKKGQQDGAELWMYTVGIYQGKTYPNKTIDMPVMHSRLLHWINYKYDLTGYLHWGWNQWTEDPFQEVGQHLGDGWHVYPSKNGVLNSLRWEQMRNGIQDYEYLKLLENKIQSLKDSLGSRFHWIDPSHRGREIAETVVQKLDKYTDDPAVLYSAKLSIIEEILEFDSFPGIYVQTHPLEHSTVKPNEYIVEVFGWAEPGTNITVNNNDVKISDSGLFLFNVALSQKNNSVRVIATKEKQSKEIVRKFVVE